MKKLKIARTENRLLDAIVNGIQEVKGKDIVHLDLRNVPNTICDHFIICHGDSDTQVDAIARSIENYTLEQASEKPWHSEGQETKGWILLDYVDIVVHIFHKSKREHYGLEQLWSDSIRNTYENVA
ncbi:MAG: ribosome silencing factor [Flavobacteriales bacterium]|nr:ribosome silencing factor [Flavobacteriales bacterium]MBL0043609.1 ribosome silencing factor [Flavobacteriales bacterium]